MTVVDASGATPHAAAAAGASDPMAATLDGGCDGVPCPCIVGGGIRSGPLPDKPPKQYAVFEVADGVGVAGHIRVGEGSGTKPLSSSDDGVHPLARSPDAGTPVFGLG